MFSSTLLLNASYEPLKIINWKRALTLLMTGKAEAVENYETEVRSQKKSYVLPAVIRLIKRVRFRRKTLKFSRENVYLRDNHTCHYCGKGFSPKDLTFDHVMPRSRGGRTTWKNIATSCKPCNQAKGDQTPEEAGMSLMNKLYVPRQFSLKSGSDIWGPYLCY